MQIIAIGMALWEEYGDGLPVIDMKRIGKTVVIAGKNGSGKTRLLSRIYGFATLHKEMAVEVLKLQLPTLTAHTVQYSHDNQNRQIFVDRVHSFRKAIYLRETITCEPIQLDSLPHIIYFVPKALSLTDSQQLTHIDCLKKAELIKTTGIDALSQGTLSYIEVLQHRHREATHQEVLYTPEQKQSAVKDYESLNALIYRFLGTTLTRSIDGNALLFGRPLGACGLSHGQTIILQFCAAIHAQGASLENLIVLMDEPENHLHPSAMIDAIDAISKELTKGQLWIATHSIPLLSHFDASCIWWMESGKVAYAGSVPQTVLKGLLGSEDRLQQLSDFLNLPSELASNQFAYQCLFSPTVVTTGSDDKQLLQITDVVKKLHGTRNVRILDFGAGKGRLPSAIYEKFDSKSLDKWLDYVAFDVNCNNQADCENAICRIYGSADGRYFSEPSKLRAKFNNGSFDVVIMCNVLHEIQPAEWLLLFSLGNTIMTLLKEDGFLLLVEDNQMPIGEKPHQKGFLVLDTEQIKILFSITESDKAFTEHASTKNGRLKAHEIPKSCLARITDLTRRNAIKSVCQTAKEQILKLRDQEGSYQNGRLHGFWVQQFANAHLFLDESGAS